MDIRHRQHNRKNSIDRWTPSLDYNDIYEDDKLRDKVFEEVKNKIVHVSPKFSIKPMMAKSNSESKHLLSKPKSKILVTTPRYTPQLPALHSPRLIYKAKSPSIKILKKPLLNFISLSPFVNDSTKSNSPRFHYGQECIKNIFVKK